jgi:hypothetical protein
VGGTNRTQSGPGSGFPGGTGEENDEVGEKEGETSKVGVYEYAGEVGEDMGAIGERTDSDEADDEEVVGEKTGAAWLRKWRRMLEFTLNARPQLGCRQRKAVDGVVSVFR